MRVVFFALALFGFASSALACHVQSCRQTLSGQTVCSCERHYP